EIFIKTGLKQHEEKKGWGSKGVLKLNINGKDYYDMENSSWWDSSWNYRFKYTIINDDLPDTESLPNFPLHIDLNGAPAGFWTHVSSETGDDIRVLDCNDSDQLEGIHLEGWNYKSKLGHIWVKKTIAQKNGTNTDCAYVYYGNASADAAWDKEGTYDANYVGVWHLDETTGNHHLDATDKSNDSTTETVTQQGADIGRVNGADEFDGSDDYVNVPDKDALDLSSTGTIEVWAKSDRAWPSDIDSYYFRNFVSKATSGQAVN
ncbi:unnamed protein product, partial [marine sediment metagenome]